MQSKPIKDWIPEFPALHRLIIPETKKREKERENRRYLTVGIPNKYVQKE